MADKEQLDLITEDGVSAWNAWRAANPRVLTDLSGADLQGCFLDKGNFVATNLQDAVLKGARLEGADFTGANLSGADLSAAQLPAAKLPDANLAGANFQNTILKNADLTGANLQGANLNGTNLQHAKLEGANIRRANLESVVIANATFNQSTLGLGRLPHGLRAGMTEVKVEAIPEDTPQEPTEPLPDKLGNLTVGYAKRIVGPAHEVLIGLSIPNDLSEAHRDLFLELLRTVADLQQRLAGLRDDNRRLSDESEELREKLDDALPLWKRAWETFVLKSAEGAGTSVGKGAVFTAGFIAGMTYSAFAAAPPGIPI